MHSNVGILTSLESSLCNYEGGRIILRKLIFTIRPDTPLFHFTDCVGGVPTSASFKLYVKLH